MDWLGMAQEGARTRTVLVWGSDAHVGVFCSGCFGFAFPSNTDEFFWFLGDQMGIPNPWPSFAGGASCPDCAAQPCLVLPDERDRPFTPGTCVYKYGRIVSSWSKHNYFIFLPIQDCCCLGINCRC